MVSWPGRIENPGEVRPLFHDVQTDPDKGWFQLLRFYSPLPAFFDKTWRAGEVELVE